MRVPDSVSGSVYWLLMAQRLYEAGYITETDSTHLSQDSIDMCREYIERNFGTDYLPEKPLHYSSKDGAQEAHEPSGPVT